MKIRLLLCCIGILLLHSCKIIKYVNQQELEMKSNELKFDLVGNKILINTEINQKDAKVLFDTGAGIFMVLDSAYIDKEAIDKMIKFGQAKLPTGNKINTGYVQADVENELFLYENYLVFPFFIPSTYKHCDSLKYEYKGIMGMNFINEMKSNELDPILSINFDEGKIEFIDRDVLSEQKKFHEEVNAEFKNNYQFHIELEINEKNEFYLFDTGNSAFDIITNDQTLSEIYSSKTYIGNLVSAADGSGFNKNVICENVTVNLKGNQLFSKVLIVDKKNKNAGLGFIKNYNWIIDYTNRKVYAKFRGNSPKFISPEITNDYYVTANVKDELVIILKNEKALKYNFGDQILQVNGVDVTDENVCEFAKKLNDKEFDWDTAYIKIKK